MLNNILDFLFPKQKECPLCGRVKGPEVLCEKCMNLLKSYLKLPTCYKCGVFLYVEEEGKPIEDNQASFSCEECLNKEASFMICRAVGPYEGLLKEGLAKFKYTGVQSLAKVFAPFMADVVISDSKFHGLLRDFRNSVLIPIPLAQEKELQRGFNQSRLLAQELGKILELAVLDNVLVKDRNTPSQAKLVKEERIRNLEGAFSIINSELLKNKSVLLIDDIFTTGSTLGECAKLLQGLGVVNISALTVAAGYRSASERLLLNKL